MTKNFFSVKKNWIQYWVKINWSALTYFKCFNYGIWVNKLLHLEADLYTKPRWTCTSKTYRIVAAVKRKSLYFCKCDNFSEIIWGFSSQKILPLFFVCETSFTNTQVFAWKILIIYIHTYIRNKWRKFYTIMIYLLIIFMLILSFPKFYTFLHLNLFDRILAKLNNFTICIV